MINVLVQGPGWKVHVEVDANIGGNATKVAARLRALGLSARRQGTWVVVEADVVPKWLRERES